MSIYSDKLVHVQVVINCQYSVAQMCTRKNKLAHSLGATCLDDIMSFKRPSTVNITVLIQRAGELGTKLMRILRKYTWTA